MLKTISSWLGKPRFGIPEKGQGAIPLFKGGLSPETRPLPSHNNFYVTKKK